MEFNEIFGLVLSFVCSSFYSGSEAAILSMSVDRTRQLIAEGGGKGHALQFLAKHANEILTTILVGNTLANIVAASLFSRITQRHFNDEALAISVGISTFLILVFGEIMPKMFARTHAEKIAFPAIRVLQINFYLFFPIVRTLNWLITSFLGKNAVISGRLVTRDDIEYMVNQAEKEKTIDSKQLDLLTSILEFPTIKVKDIMVPRTQVKYISLDAGLKDIVDYALANNHSRYPVCTSDLDKTVGFLHIKDIIFIEEGNRQNFDIHDYLKDPFFVYEHMKIHSVFDYMNRKKVHLALVKDENGMVVGIITLEDIMEEIFGEIHDEHDKVVAKEQHEGFMGVEGIVIDGSISLRDLYAEYDLKIPLNDNYSTLRGFLLDRMGNHFPEEGMIFFWEGLSFKIEKVVDHQIMEVRIADVEGEKHLYSKRAIDQENDIKDRERGEG
jgi:putative hemolysin